MKSAKGRGPRKNETVARCIGNQPSGEVSGPSLFQSLIPQETLVSRARNAARIVPAPEKLAGRSGS